MAEYPKIKLDVGSVGSGPDEINDQMVVLQAGLDIDALDDLLIPYHGVIIHVALEYSGKEISSTFEYARLETLFDFYQTLSSRHTLRFNARYLHSWETEPFYKTTFFVGGPETFFGLQYLGGFGTRFFIWRFDYRYRIFKDLYLQAVLNSSPHYRLGLPGTEVDGTSIWGFGFGLIYDSILGPLKLDFSWGEKTPFYPGTYLSRIYFTAGYRL